MSWWTSFFHKRAPDAQLDSELRFHIDKLTDENIAAGMTPDEAHRRAMLEFGGQEQVKEDLRDVYRIRLLDATVANVKSAFRFIRKSPTFFRHRHPHVSTRHRGKQRCLLRRRRHPA